MFNHKSGQAKPSVIKLQFAVSCSKLECFAFENFASKDDICELGLEHLVLQSIGSPFIRVKDRL
jgi:hypothetical protein